MTSPLIPLEIGFIETDELTTDDEAKLFICPKCEKKFQAYVETIQGDPDMMPKVELTICADCEKSLDPINLYLLWMDWNNEDDTIH